MSKEADLDNLTLGKGQKNVIISNRGDIMTESFWKRKDLYRENGKCVYAEICDDYKENCNPEECKIWECFFDGETQADEVLSDT